LITKENKFDCKTNYFEKERKDTNDIHNDIINHLNQSFKCNLLRYTDTYNNEITPEFLKTLLLQLINKYKTTIEEKYKKEIAEYFNNKDNKKKFKELILKNSTKLLSIINYRKKNTFKGGKRTLKKTGLVKSKYRSKNSKTLHKTTRKKYISGGINLGAFTKGVEALNSNVNKVMDLKDKFKNVSKKLKSVNTDMRLPGLNFNTKPTNNDTKEPINDPTNESTNEPTIGITNEVYDKMSKIYKKINIYFEKPSNSIFTYFDTIVIFMNIYDFINKNVFEMRVNMNTYIESILEKTFNSIDEITPTKEAPIKKDDCNNNRDSVSKVLGGNKDNNIIQDSDLNSNMFKFTKIIAYLYCSGFNHKLKEIKHKYKGSIVKVMDEAIEEYYSESNEEYIKSLNEKIDNDEKKANDDNIIIEEIISSQDNAEIIKKIIDKCNTIIEKYKGDIKNGGAGEDICKKVENYKVPRCFSNEKEYKKSALIIHPDKLKTCEENVKNKGKEKFQELNNNHDEQKELNNATAINDENYEHCKKKYPPQENQENVPTENVPIENVPTENVPTENVPTENVQTENVQTEPVKSRESVAELPESITTLLYKIVNNLNTLKSPNNVNDTNDTMKETIQIMNDFVKLIEKIDVISIKDIEADIRELKYYIFIFININNLFIGGLIEIKNINNSIINDELKKLKILSNSIIPIHDNNSANDKTIEEIKSINQTLFEKYQIIDIQMQSLSKKKIDLANIYIIYKTFETALTNKKGVEGKMDFIDTLLYSSKNYENIVIRNFLNIINDKYNELYNKNIKPIYKETINNDILKSIFEYYSQCLHYYKYKNNIHYYNDSESRDITKPNENYENYKDNWNFKGNNNSVHNVIDNYYIKSISDLYFIFEEINANNEKYNTIIDKIKQMKNNNKNEIINQRMKRNEEIQKIICNNEVAISRIIRDDASKKDNNNNIS